MRTLQKLSNCHECRLENNKCFVVLFYVILNYPSGHQHVQAIGFMAVTFSVGLTGAVILQWRTASFKAQFIQPCCQSKQILSMPVDWYSGLFDTRIWRRMFIIGSLFIHALLPYNATHVLILTAIISRQIAQYLLQTPCYCSFLLLACWATYQNRSLISEGFLAFSPNNAKIFRPIEQSVFVFTL